MAETDAKSISLSVRVWLGKRDEIRLTSKDAGGFISTVSNDPKSERYHPHLFAKLTACLKEAGVDA